MRFQRWEHPIVVGADTEKMLWQHRQMAADDLARVFSLTAQSFADTFIQYVAATHGGESEAAIGLRRRESCALIWAAVEATLIASALTDEERDKVVPLVRDALMPYWRKYRVDTEDFITRVRERSAAYLRHQDRMSQLKTAAGFMNELLSNLDAETARLLPVKTLTALLAHRMLSDLRRLNEIKSGHSII
jgi:hypothetical protein